MVTLVMLEQFLNAQYFISVTSLGIASFVTSLLFKYKFRSESLNIKQEFGPAVHQLVKSAILIFKFSQLRNT